MNDIQDQLVHVAQAIIDEKIDLILGCREIDRLRSHTRLICGASNVRCNKFGAYENDLEMAVV